tara:strand:+ start:42701 stop:43900 length:1200 start_codon:yes stop_codon:yes gene_type:complete
MDFSPQQLIALDDVRAWLDALLRGESTKQVFRIFGYAGTGKTTIAKEFASMVEGLVIFGCYTGKAAHVLRTKGCANAGTLHALIYQPKGRSAVRLQELQIEYVEQEKEGASPRVLAHLKRSIAAETENMKRPSFAIKEETDLREASLLVIDEVSMVDEIMGADLESFGVPILVLGDPAQLPPVKGGGHFTNATPDILLTEIHRQAADSPILALATDIREGRGFANAGDLVRPLGQSIEFMAGFDQILCGTNKTRKIVNEKLREHLGFVDLMPMPGDRLICTRNDGDTGLLNGGQWQVLNSRWDPGLEELWLTICSVDNDEQLHVQAHPEYFIGEEPPYFMVRKKQCFDFAYCMTVHKSQGSQFDSVCLIDEAARFPSAQRRAHRYTGVTRAAKELTVIR